MRVVWAFFLLLGLLAAGCRGQARGAPITSAGALAGVTLGELQGQVSVLNVPSGEAVPAMLGQALTLGAQVQTGINSQARLDFSNGSVLRLAANSEFTLLLSVAAGEAGPLIRGRLEVGKVWATLADGVLEVETPGGLARLDGSFADFEYLRGAPSTPADDLLILNCLRGDCEAQVGGRREALGSLEQLRVTGGIEAVRLTLDPEALDEFLAQNPLVTLIEPGPTITRPASDPTQTLAAPATGTPSPTRPFVATATPIDLTPSPAAGPLGEHVVQAGENLTCIAGAYGVLPDAIAEANLLTAPFTLFPGDILTIPAAPWPDAPDASACDPQFVSPYLDTATAPTPTAAPA